METLLHLAILPQPDDTTCGPTCLHAVFNYFGDELPLDDVIANTSRLEKGGTLAVYLGSQAIRRGYRARLYTYDLQVFDPSWFDGKHDTKMLALKLRAQAETKTGHRLHAATKALLEYLTLGGEVRFEDLTGNLIRHYLNRDIPILAGLSATYLYHTMREFGPDDDYDDIRGKPSGHFVVLCGYNRTKKTVLVADPMHPNPVSDTQYYEVDISRLVCAILLGVLTNDANLLIIQPGLKR
ncbi:C39 family peptidase [bacterium]|nr:C39 family peptidase [bacterium]